MQIYLQYFNKNSSTAVPLWNERYEFFLAQPNFWPKKFADRTLWVKNMQIYLQYFNKNSSTAVPLRNAQSPQEQIVRSDLRIREVSSPEKSRGGF